MKKMFARLLISLAVITLCVSISTPALAMGKRPATTDEGKKLPPAAMKNVKAGPLTLKKVKTGVLVAVFAPAGDQEELATAEVTCANGRILRVSTGTTGGDCSIELDADGNVGYVICEDGNNMAMGNCQSGDLGAGNCIGRNGSGSCSSTLAPNS